MNYLTVKRKAESEDEISNIGVMPKTWKFLNPLTSEDDIIGGWYAGIFSNKKRTTLYIGKARRLFLGDVDGPCVSVELDCLKPNVSSSTVFESTPDHLPDVGNFHTEDIIAGLLIVKPLRRKKWEVPNYNNVKKMYEEVVKLNRKTLSEQHTM